MKTDKSLFRYKAVIDFIQISFKTTQRSNGFSIKRNTGLPYVKPIDKGPGSATNIFSFRLHDIENWQQFDTTIKHLKKRYELESEPTITGVEVSFDAYAKGASYDEMIEHVAHYFCFLANPVSVNRRFSKGYKGTAIGLTSRTYTIRRLFSGGTIYIGDQRYDSKSMRIYYKQTDHNKQPIEQNEHRARIEITLLGKDCPFGNIEEARNYDFTKLKDYFRFTELREGLKRFDEVLADRIPIVGERKIRRRIGGGGHRIYSKLVIPDAELNEIVYDRLRNLSKSLNSSRMRKTR